MKKVKEYMSQNVVTVSPTDTLGKARNLMLENKMRRLVVVDKGRVVGIITAFDLAKALSKRGAPWRWRNPENSLVERFMTPNPVTIEPEASVFTAAKLMVSKGIGGLPVVKDGSLQGIITETDVTRFYAENMHGRFKVGDLMDRSYITVPPHTNLKRVAKVIARDRKGRVLVVDSSGKLLGIVTEGEIALWEPSLARKYVLIPSRSGRISKDLRARTVEQIMKKVNVTLSTEDDASKAARMLIEWGLSVFPVVSNSGKIIGVIDKKSIVKGVVNASE